MNSIVVIVGDVSVLKYLDYRSKLGMEFIILVCKWHSLCENTYIGTSLSGSVITDLRLQTLDLSFQYVGIAS